MDKLAYTLDEAAAACGVSRDVVDRAVAQGNLICVYPTSRPVITRTELQEWVESWPTERPKRDRRSA